MSTGRYSTKRRTAFQVSSDAEADRLAHALGRMLRDARGPSRTQSDAAAIAGLAQTTYSLLERGRGGNISLKVWTRASRAVGADLHAYLERTTAAEAPRDAVHLRHQELIARTAVRGGWRLTPEAPLDMTPESRSADLVLRRGSEVALIEVVDWIADGGAELRSWERRLARLRTRHAGESVRGCFVLRATRRNRRLVAAHATLFASAFPGSSTAWLRAITSPEAETPATAGFLWVSVNGQRLYAQRRHVDKRAHGEYHVTAE